MLPGCSEQRAGSHAAGAGLGRRQDRRAASGLQSGAVDAPSADSGHAVHQRHAAGQQQTQGGGGNSDPRQQLGLTEQRLIRIHTNLPRGQENGICSVLLFM